MDKNTAANREYKNSVFTLLFGDIALPLYCAITGKTYDPSAKFEMMTLTDVLWRGRLNDLAFILDDRLVVLIEHQSSINANMPLRMLQYIARTYERYIERIYGKSAVYKESMLEIPRPEFIVLYNGTKEMPGGDRHTMKLSDMFAGALPESAPPMGGLELTVEMFNINKGRNPEMAERCRELSEYETFIQMIRDNEAAGMPLNEAVVKAVEYCIENNILRDFLKQYRWEVVDMLTFEWDFDLEKKVAAKVAADERALNIARALIDKGSMTVDEIAEVTGLTVDDVLRLM